MKQKYIGEKIPETWFNFETSLKTLSKSKALISFTDLVHIAEASSIFNEPEIIQATRFLADLGTVQYFESSDLTDKIIINPQWIVDAMACLVSVKETFIESGYLKHEDIGRVWSNYEPELHEWILKLTEEFDLSYLVPEKRLSIVPCLLSDEEPMFEWPEMPKKNDTSMNKIREFHVIYNFDYIPAGLFNRMQVRLYNFAKSTIWKNGSILEKNNQ